MSRWRRYHFTGPPKQLRRPGVKLDNLALVPASLLPFKAQYQAIANDLPTGEMLIIRPVTEKSRRVLDAVSDLLKAKGCRISMVPAERFT